MADIKDERDRVKACIHFQSTDKIPWQIGYTTELGFKLMKSLGIEEQQHFILGKNIYHFNGLEDFFGNHLTFIRNRAVNSLQEIESGIFRDEWDVLWDRRIDRDIGTPINCVLETMNLEKMRIPDPLDPDRYAHFEPIIRANPRRYKIVKFSYSLFERAWSLRRMETLMMDFIQNPLFVHELLDLITEYNMRLIRNLKHFNIDALYFGDDWGYQRGLLMSPDTWREFIKPRIRKMYDQAHAHGYDVFIHSCGNITNLLDDLVEVGVNVFNPFQPEVIDLEDVIATYEKKLAFYGGLSIQHTLPFGTPREVRAEVVHRLGLAKKFGGYIISPSHDMPPDIPLETIMIMYQALKS